jgi:protein-disulfide isomerase
MIDRRTLLAGAIGLPAIGLGFGPDEARADGSWYPVVDDDGRPVINMRVPIELIAEVEALPGIFWASAAQAPYQVIEFFDYNCPFCRKAAKDIDRLAQTQADLKVGFVNSPILSPYSIQAAKVELALLRHAGPVPVYALHKRLLQETGRVDGSTALAAAAELGFPRATLEPAADSRIISDALTRQSRIAASLGLAATPSFLIGDAAILGYPGPASLERMIEALRRCNRIAC